MTGVGIATLSISVLAVGEIILSYSAELKGGVPSSSEGPAGSHSI